LTEQAENKTLIVSARRALSVKDYDVVEGIARSILRLNANSDEGLFLLGKAALQKGNFQLAETSLIKALKLNPRRHDAAVELANIFSHRRRNAAAFNLIDAAIPHMQNSPKYLDLAGTILVEIGMPEKAWPLYVRANELQPDVPILKSNLANCGVFVGEFEVAKKAFEELIEANPTNRQNHFHYAKLLHAENTDHIKIMEEQLEDTSIPSVRNVPLYFSIAKEYEDLGDYRTAFEYYERGNSEAASQIKYDPEPDIALIDHIIENCTQDWVQENKDEQGFPEMFSSPIFIVGLPRTGTTLVERILSSHSEVSSLGETLFIPNSAAFLASQKLERQTPIYTPEAYSAFMSNCADLPAEYLNHLSYRIGMEPWFIEKLPLNYLFLGPLAKVWPNAKFVHLKRGAMDTGFSMFKQLFTWAYKFSYDLENIGNYYVAYCRLMDHWKSILGDRIIEIEYEQLTHNPDHEVRSLLNKLEFPFEPDCLNFENNKAASTTASLVQVRSGMSTASVGRWKNFETQLAPLKDILLANNIGV